MKDEEIYEAEIVDEENASVSKKSNAGRPRIHIDKDFFEELCRLQCTEEDIARAFRCSVDTIGRWCKRTYDMNFAEVFKMYSADGKISLRRNLFKLSEKYPAVAIFLAKNMLGMSDRPNEDDIMEKLDKILGNVENNL